MSQPETEQPPTNIPETPAAEPQKPDEAQSETGPDDGEPNVERIAAIDGPVESKREMTEKVDAAFRKYYQRKEEDEAHHRQAESDAQPLPEDEPTEVEINRMVDDGFIDLRVNPSGPPPPRPVFSGASIGSFMASQAPPASHDLPAEPTSADAGEVSGETPPLNQGNRHLIMGSKAQNEWKENPPTNPASTMRQAFDLQSLYWTFMGIVEIAGPALTLEAMDKVFQSMPPPTTHRYPEEWYLTQRYLRFALVASKAMEEMDAVHRQQTATGHAVANEAKAAAEARAIAEAEAQAEAEAAQSETT